MKNKFKIGYWIGGVVFALTIMGFAPFGNFNPSKLGFWLSVGAGVLWSLLMKITLDRYQSPQK